MQEEKQEPVCWRGWVKRKGWEHTSLERGVCREGHVQRAREASRIPLDVVSVQNLLGALEKKDTEWKAGSGTWVGGEVS